MALSFIEKENNYKGNRTARVTPLAANVAVIQRTKRSKFIETK